MKINNIIVQTLDINVALMIVTIRKFGMLSAMMILKLYLMVVTEKNTYFV